MSDVCPHCGQRMLIRLGVPLSAKQADVFDMIAKGRPNEQIFWVLFPNSKPRQALNTLKAHIWGINERLIETDYQIKSDRSGRYILKRDTPAMAPTEVTQTLVK